MAGVYAASFSRRRGVTLRCFAVAIAALPLLLLAACERKDTTPVVYGDSSYQIKTACADNRGAYTPTSITYSASTEVAVAPVVWDADFLTVDIPEAAVSMGIAVRGTNTNYKFIDHGILLVQPAVCITGPLGNVPLAFNQVDFDNPADGKIEDDPSSLFNREAPAVFFPNDGSQLILPAGSYSFPIGAVNVSFTDLEVDTLQPYVYYKTPTASPTTVSVNLFVASGVGAGLTSVAAIEADPEIQGAIQVLRNVYETDADTALNLSVVVGMVPSSYVIIGTDFEQDTLLQSYPSPADHASINLFVVGSLSNNLSGVLGLTAGLPGPFNLQGTAASGILAEYQGDGIGTELGFVLAHELGHYLGLNHTSQTSPYEFKIIGHDPLSDTPVCTTQQLMSPGNVNNCPDRTNFMFPIVDSNPTPVVTPKQGTVMRGNPAVSSVGSGILKGRSRFDAIAIEAGTDPNRSARAPNPLGSPVHHQGIRPDGFLPRSRLDAAGREAYTPVRVGIAVDLGLGFHLTDSVS